MIGLPERAVFSVFIGFGDICRVFKICTLMTFNYNPTDYSFTSAIPDVFTISDFQGEMLFLRIYLNRSQYEVFSTTLYAYQNAVSIYDLRSVIESYMEENHLVYCDCTFQIIVDRVDYSIPEFKLIYCHAAVNANCRNFLQSHFLVNSNVRLVPHGWSLDLSYIVFPDESATCSTHLVVQPASGEEPQVIDLVDPPITSAQFQLCTIDLNEEDLLARIPSSLGLCQLLSATIYYGERSFTIFFTDETPTLTLYYFNTFNCTDIFPLTAVTKRKLAFSRSTAICCGKSSSYDDQTEVEFESESSSLTPSEARQLTTALQSSSLFIVSPDYPQGSSILVTDIESELSDASNELCHVKFTWKPVRQQPTLSATKHIHIFNSTYNHTFN